MIRRLALLISLLALPALPAQASFWMECEYVVAGDITPDENGMYAITPLSSKVINGHSEKGVPCDTADAQYPISISIDGEKPENTDTITLHYKLFNGMTPDGVINDERWTFVPHNFLQRVFK
jgi:hypothetical protein